MPRGKRLYEVSDTGIAERCMRELEARCAFTPSHGWLAYTGSYWTEDIEGAQVSQAVVRILRRCSQELRESGGRPQDIEFCVPNDYRINAIMRRLSKLLLVDIRAFDALPDHLNVTNGVLDLRTGRVTGHKADQHFTYCLPVAYDKDADQTLWQQLLDSSVDPTLHEFLQTAVGYTLTGHTGDDKFFFLFGGSRSGKGSFLGAINKLLGHPLATTCQYAVFTRKRGEDSNNFDLAPLKPCRMVLVDEFPRNIRLNEALLKTVTGGGELCCCFKRKDAFTYVPQFKLWFISNHDIIADPYDDGFWRRIVRIPFPFSRDEAQVDRTFRRRLQEPECLAGVLAWAVEGAKRWYKEGLVIPESLQADMVTTRRGQDPVQRWLDEEAVFVTNGFVENDVLYKSYSQWCREHRIRTDDVLDVRTFGKRLSTFGLQGKRTSSARGRAGLQLVET